MKFYPYKKGEGATSFSHAEGARGGGGGKEFLGSSNKSNMGA